MKDINIKQMKAEAKAKAKANKQPRTIKVKTVVIGIFVILIAVATGIGVNYLRDQSYKDGYNKGQAYSSQRDETVVKRIVEVKSLMAELKK